MGAQTDPAKAAAPAPDAADDCPLSRPVQVWNLLLYGGCWALIYLAGAVLYVGIVQAALFDKLGASKTVANLPNSVYFWATPLPILVAWYFPQFRLFKRVLAGGFLAAALGGVVVAASLLTPTPEPVARALVAVGLPPHWSVPVVIAHAALIAGAIGTVWTYLWEVLARGVGARWRGKTLALAFGVGPLLAALGSLGSQYVLEGKLRPPGFAAGLATWNFAVLYGATVPIMALAALLATQFVLPPPDAEAPRPPFFAGVFGGLGDYFRNPLISVAALSFVLCTVGYNILPNFTLYTPYALGAEPEQYAGYQQALRFGFKVVMGLGLGWFLHRMSPRTPMLVTGGCCLASTLWALTMTGWPFLISFGLMGAGELMGMYYPNYIFACSPPAKVRRNMAFVVMLNMPAGFAGVLYGGIADAPADKQIGLRASFWVSVVILVVTLFIVTMLPARPRPAADSDAQVQPAA